LDISVRKQANVQVIKLRGNLKLGVAADSFKQLLDEMAKNNETQLVLSVEEVPIMDSSGIGTLVRGLTAMKKLGGSIKLVKPSKMVIQTLKLVAVFNLFEIFDDDDAAVASYK
jgi:anti-sigma B factor antagonist